MRRRIVIVLIAAVLAVFSAVAVLAYAQDADERALKGQKGRLVLLATGVIPAGTTVADIRTKRLVRQVLMPTGTVPDGALDKLDPALDTNTLNAPLQPDQMLLDGQFKHGTATNPSPSPALPLPPDKIAVSVELGIAPQVAGNVDPGDKVAVFFTFPKVDSEAQPQTTSVLLPSVTVISVGERSTATAPPPMPSAGASAAPTAATESLERYVVTLAVTSSEAERLIVSYNRGLLHLGLLGSKAKIAGGVA